MTRTVLALQRALIVVLLAVSGTYVVVYLTRWEWNRALICGLFFLASEVALATSMLLRRLRRIEHRDVGTRGAIGERLREANAPRLQPFQWLKTPGMNVFVPVLLGAGVVLTALAYVVERLAQASAGLTVDRTLTRRLEGVSLPSRRLVEPLPQASRPQANSGGDSAGRSFVTLGAVAALAVLSIVALRDATQSRPDPAIVPAQTTIELDIAQKRTKTDAVSASEALWVACRSVFAGHSSRAVSIQPAGERRAQMVITPGLGGLSERRVRGCLSDLTLPLVRARVLSIEHTP